jgi:DnaJ family protein C protein 1
MREQKEEEAREQARIQEELEEQRKIAEEPKKPRKRKTFVIPEKEFGEDEDAEEGEENKSDTAKPARPTYVSGGLWTDEDLGELSKLCSKFPGGTPERWEKISDALRRPVPEVTFMAKKVMEKLVKRPDDEEERPQLKVKVKTKGGKADAIAAGDIDNVTSWTLEEQKYLEKAILVYPKGALERWDKIASMVPGRSKEECIARFKYLAELVKKKKEQEKSAENPEETSGTQEEVPANNEKEQREEQQGGNGKSEDDPSKDGVERKNSSSSNKSSSDGDGDWCMVES